MEAAMIGVFVATDLLLFYVFFELTLLPMYLVIGVWGGANRIYAAIKFFLFTIAGSLLMLLGIIYLAFAALSRRPASITFTITDLYGIVAAAARADAALLRLRAGLRHQGAALPAAHLAAGRARRSADRRLDHPRRRHAEDGHVRLPPLRPAVLPRRHREVRRRCSSRSRVIGIIYGALVAWVQPDMKKLVAYSSVSHLGFCVLGIFALNQTSIEGSILQMVNHGLSTGALFLLVGVIYERRHTRLLADYGGLAKTMPVYATLLHHRHALVGRPAGPERLHRRVPDPGRHRSRRIRALAIVAATGVILAAIYLLWLVQRVFFGPITNEENRTSRRSPGTRSPPSCRWSSSWSGSASIRTRSSRR